MEESEKEIYFFDLDPAKEYLNDGGLVSTSPQVINYTNPLP